MMTLAKEYTTAFRNDGRGGILNLEIVKGKCAFNMIPVEYKKEKIIKKQKKKLWR